MRWVLAVAVAAGCSSRPLGSDGGGQGSSGSGAESTTTAGGVTSVGTTAAGTSGVTSGADGTSTGILETGPDTSDTCPFICEPDLGPIPDTCDVVDQDCPAGQKCVWYAPPGGLRRDAARCIEVTGAGEPFDPCTLPTGIGLEITDDCGPESFCLEVYGTADHGYCAPFFDDVEGCDAYPGSYPAFENGSDFPAACLHYECQPMLPEGCPDGLQCTFYPAWLYGSLMCWNVPPEDDLPLSAACDYGQCGQGQLCAPTQWLPDCTDDRCCTQWCDLGAPACDTPGTVCEPFPVRQADGDPGFDSLGACVLEGAFD